MSSSRSDVVTLSVRPFVRPFVRPSVRNLIFLFSKTKLWSFKTPHNLINYILTLFLNPLPPLTCHTLPYLINKTNKTKECTYPSQLPEGLVFLIHFYFKLTNCADKDKKCIYKYQSLTIILFLLEIYILCQFCCKYFHFFKTKVLKLNFEENKLN